MTGLRIATACLSAAAVLATPGCAGLDGDGDGVDVDVLLVTPDNNIRVEGIECAGARPFQYVHAGSRFTLEAEDGTVLYEGELPPGRAENADPTIDWESDRMPTVCVFALEIDDVPEEARYVLAVEGGAPLSFDASLLASGEPLRLVAR
ncbi:MAG TPA: hypothetical protein VK915_13815 [Gaiellaceae bacterium]|nr:hypothetical protein [Gaiellaceae bacterium]